MERRDFLKATTAATLAFATPGLASLQPPTEVRYEPRYSGVGWNGWGFYHVDRMPIVDGICQEGVPGSLKFEVWYDRDAACGPPGTGMLLFRLPLPDDRRIPHKEVYSCCLSDKDAITQQDELHVRIFAVAIASYLKERGQEGEAYRRLRDDTRLGRMLKFLLKLAKDETGFAVNWIVKYTKNTPRLLPG